MIDCLLSLISFIITSLPLQFRFSDSLSGSSLFFDSSLFSLILPLYPRCLPRTKRFGLLLSLLKFKPFSENSLEPYPHLRCYLIFHSPPEPLAECFPSLSLCCRKPQIICLSTATSPRVYGAESSWSIITMLCHGRRSTLYPFGIIVLVEGSVEVEG